MSIELKIKSKHLGGEARIIKFEERKLLAKIDYKRQKFKQTGANDEFLVWRECPKLQRLYWSISTHRKWDVRNENRATFLARAYIDGKDYKAIEQKVKPEREYILYHIVPRIVEMVNKYSTKRVDKPIIHKWLGLK